MEDAAQLASSSPTKIQRPRLDQVYNRTRLFRFLDTIESSSMVWISAPAGSGKTTLAASYLDHKKIKPLWYHVDEGDADVASFFYYMGQLAKQAVPRLNTQLPILTPEFMPSLPVFTRNFFREFFKRMKPPAVLVLDNYQEAGTDTVLDSIIPILVNEVPRSCRVIVTSRSDPPASLARYRANKELSLIAWDDMRITQDEAGHIASIHDRSGRLNNSTDVAQQILTDCDGWAAGLVLLLEQGSSISASAPDPEAGREVMFDYFLQEILAGTDPVLVDFLLLTSYLPQITVHVARALTDNQDADRVLQSLCRRNYFITRHAGKQTSYRYHDLFRHFLQQQAAKTFSREQVQHIRRRAGLLLLEQGESDAAVDLLIQAEAWQEAVAGILRLAPQMLANGRAQSLDQWFKRLPEHLANENPWVTYWMGICELGFQPVRALELFTSAYHKFKQQNDVAGLYHAWAGAVDAIYMSQNDHTQLDQWISEFDRLQDEGEEIPARDIEERVYGSLIRIIFWRQPNHPLRTAYVAHAKKLFESSENVELRVQLGADLLIQLVVDGRMHEGARFVEQLKHQQIQDAISPVARVNYLAMVGFLNFYLGRVDAAATIATQALSYADETGCHVLDPMIIGFGCYALLTKGEVEPVNKLLERMSQQLAVGADNLSRALYLSIAAWRDASIGEFALAEYSLHRMSEITTHVGVAYPTSLAQLMLANVLMESGRMSEGRNELHRAQKTMECDLIKYNCVLLDALYMLRENKEEEGCARLREALAIAVADGFGNPVFWRPELLAELALKALERGIETDHVRNLIRSHHLAPPSGQPIPDSWPFPVKIYTFGQFKMLVDNQPVRMEKKAQKKPVEMLKALIALGGSGVAETHITDMLWPDTDADRAHHSFKANLHRLRRLIGNDSVILHEGRLSLDPQLVWCDARAFGQDRDQALQALHAGDIATTTEHTRRLLKLYSAPFLPGDDLACIYATRERYRNQLMGLLGDLGHALYEAGSYSDSAQFYSVGLEIDPLMETLTQGLLRCYLRLRQPVEALRAYEYCRETLQRELGLKPSPDTEALVEAAHKISG